MSWCRLWRGIHRGVGLGGRMLRVGGIRRQWWLSPRGHRSGRSNAPRRIRVRWIDVGPARFVWWMFWRRRWAFLWRLGVGRSRRRWGRRPWRLGWARWRGRCGGLLCWPLSSWFLPTALIVACVNNIIDRSSIRMQCSFTRFGIGTIYCRMIRWPRKLALFRFWKRSETWAKKIKKPLFRHCLSHYHLDIWGHALYVDLEIRTNDIEIRSCRGDKEGEN